MAPEGTVGSRGRGLRGGPGQATCGRLRGSTGSSPRSSLAGSPSSGQRRPDHSRRSAEDRPRQGNLCLRWAGRERSAGLAGRCPRRPGTGSPRAPWAGPGQQRRLRPLSAPGEPSLAGSRPRRGWRCFRVRRGRGSSFLRCFVPSRAGSRVPPYPGILGPPLALGPGKTNSLIGDHSPEPREPLLGRGGSVCGDTPSLRKAPLTSR